MSTPRQSKFTMFLANVVPACLVGCAFAFYAGKELTGWGLLITGLVVRISVTQETHHAVIQANEIAPSAGAEDEWGDGTFHLSLTTPELERNSGWESVVVYKEPAQYERTLCYGGPPVFKELWEYQIKQRSFVFQRMLDDYIDDLWDPRYEVVNGCVQEHLIEVRHAEDKGGIKVTTPETKIARLRQQVQWHEVDGILRFFILAKLGYSGWRSDAQKLKDGVSEIGGKAEALGATMGENGWYQLPDDASEEQKRVLDRLFSPWSLRSHGFRSYTDWRERDHIMKLLEPPTEAQS